MNTRSHNYGARGRAPQRTLLFAAAGVMTFGSALAQSAATGQALWDNGRASPPLLACGTCHNGAADPANGLNLSFLRARLAGSGGLDAGNAAAAINRALRVPGGVGVMLTAYPASSISTTEIDHLAAFIAQAPAVPLPTATVAPTALSFQATGVEVDSAPQLVTVTNTSGQSATLANIPIVALTTSAHPTDFLLGGAGSLNGAVECTAGRNLAPSGSCAIRVLFRPTATGARSASWEVRFSQGSPVVLPMSGTGTPAPAMPAPAPAAAAPAGNSGGGALPAFALFALFVAAWVQRVRGVRESKSVAPARADV